MKAKTGIHIYHNTVIVVNQKASEAHHKMERSNPQACLMPECNQVLIPSQNLNLRIQIISFFILP